METQDRHNTHKSGKSKNGEQAIFLLPRYFQSSQQRQWQNAKYKVRDNANRCVKEPPYFKFDAFASGNAFVPKIANWCAGEAGHHQNGKAICDEEGYEAPSRVSILPFFEKAQELTANGAFGKYKT